MRAPLHAGSVVCCVALLTGGAPASAAVPSDGRYEGRSSQDTRAGKPIRVAFSIVRDGRAVSRIAFPSVARCGRRGNLRVGPANRGGASLVNDRISIRGTLRGRVGHRLRFRAVYLMDGRFPTGARARGTWRLRVELLNRDGEQVGTCKTGRVTWRAARL